MRYYSRGKLLIAGEYLVLKGAKALAVPLGKGQDLSIHPNSSPGIIKWASSESGKIWFTAQIDMTFFQLLEPSDPQIGKQLIHLLKAARDLNPAFLTDKQVGFDVETNLEFNREWGFGSSSSLLSNVAYWANVDPIKLHRKLYKGSGYDVVTARQKHPVLFRLNDAGSGYGMAETAFNPPFHDHLFFIYLGQKQHSETSVKGFLKDEKDYTTECREVNQIVDQMIESKTLHDFESTMKAHEGLLSGILKTPSLKQCRFDDLPGQVKSLGAWGGDFALLSWSDSIEKLMEYLKTKNISTWFTYKSLVYADK